MPLHGIAHDPAQRLDEPHMVLGNCTYLHELYRLISSCVIPDMASLPNPGLNDALDSQEQTGALLPEGQRVALSNSDQRAAGSHDYYGNL